MMFKRSQRRIIRLSTGVGGGKGPICRIVATVSDAPKIFQKTFLAKNIKGRTNDSFSGNFAIRL
jgi:hypothetical protein